MRIPAQLRLKDEKDDDTRALVAWAVDVVRALKDLQAVPFLDGVRLDNVAIGTTDTLVQHKLGRVPRGFWWINPSAGTFVWQPAAPTNTHIHLQAGMDVVADVWVF